MQLSERKPRRKSASSTHHRGPAHREVPHADWQPPRRRGADGTEAIGLRVLVTPANLKDVNAFALPGGPMFVQRGMFDAAA